HVVSLFFVMPRSPRSSLFPYTTLFRSAEVGGRRLLSGGDDAAADGAGAGEEVEQLVALAVADIPLQRRQVLVEAAEHLEDRLLRSEEHTSELQSRENLVCRLLLEKKKD